MGVNSIRALKLSVIVPRILNKKDAFICGWFLGLCSSRLFIFDEHFFVTFFSVRYFLVSNETGTGKVTNCTKDRVNRIRIVRDTLRFYVSKNQGD